MLDNNAGDCGGCSSFCVAGLLNSKNQILDCENQERRNNCGSWDFDKRLHILFQPFG